MKPKLLRVAVLAAVLLTAACQPCRDYAAAVHASASSLEPYTHAGIDAAEGLGADERRALHDEAKDLVRTAAVAAGGAR